MSRFVNLEFDGQAGENIPFTESVKLTAKDEAFYQREAQTAFESGDFYAALRAYAKLLEFNANNAAAWTAQVRVLAELDQLQEAGAWADRALEKFPHEADLLAAKAEVLARSGEMENALAFSDAAVGENGVSPNVWLSRGDILLTARQTLADYCIEKAMMLAPGDWMVALQAARIRCRHKQFSLALRPLQQAVEWNPQHFGAWLELGKCQEALGLANAAEKSFVQAQALKPNDPTATEALSRLSSRGAADKVREWWRRICK